MSVAYESYHATDVFGTNLVSSGSTNTKGSYVQCTASCGITINELTFAVRFITTSGRYLVDIATGAGGSETVVVANMLWAGASKSGCGHVRIPVAIASGTRIAARCQSSAATATINTAVLVASAADGAAWVTSPSTHTYGENTGTTDGTAVDAGAVGSTKGAYAQITAATSTTNPLYWLAALWRTQNASSDQAYMFDIATGAGGAETVIVPDVSLTSGGNDLENPAYDFFVNIATGTRIAIRSLCGGTGSPDRINNVVLVGAEGTLAAGSGTNPVQPVNTGALVGV